MNLVGIEALWVSLVIIGIAAAMILLQLTIEVFVKIVVEFSLWKKRGKR